MQRQTLAALSVVALLLAFSTAASAAEWGTLKGKFVLDGKSDAPAKLSIAKDKATCCKDGCPTDDTLLVDPNGGIANIVIYLRTKKSDKVAVHPDYEKDAKAKVEFDNQKCMFTPHVLAMRTSQTLVLKNSDPVAHNTNLQPVKNDAKNVLIPANGSVEHKFGEAETLPAPAMCNIHPWMKGYIIPRDDPYIAVTGADGSFEIKNLPAGDTLEFQIWHERPGYVRDVMVGGKKASRGRAKIKIAAGDNDIGTIKVPSSLMKK